VDIPDPFAGRLPPEAWGPARRAAAKVVSPLVRVLAIEASSGILLIVATAIALAWANSPWAESYAQLWHVPVGVSAGDGAFVRPLHFWVNDGLMTVFFFVVGLEIRREIYEGELATLRQAALPLAAAFGGMLVPAAIFAVINAGRAGAAGWGVPMATDIAFAVGVLTLLGSRVPTSLRILLLALAVIDDIGAILVIAIFYTPGFELAGLAITAAGLGGVVALRAVGVRAAIAYLAPGVVVWAGLYAAGVHPTLAGVLLGLLTPVRSWFGASGFAATTHDHLDDLGALDRHDLVERLAVIERARREAVSPAERLLHVLHPWVAFGVMPLFALANAGVALGGADLGGDGLYVFVGILAGLVAGKPLGIFLVSAAVTRAGLATRAADVSARGVALVGVVGGIGFTMSLFIAQLAFPPGPLLDTAKLAILVASATASILGLVLGALTLRAR
jgi:Na+:H+ antiporter, NhaA family